MREATLALQCVGWSAALENLPLTRQSQSLSGTPTHFCILLFLDTFSRRKTFLAPPPELVSCKKNSVCPADTSWTCYVLAFFSPKKVFAVFKKKLCFSPILKHVWAECSPVNPKKQTVSPTLSVTGRVSVPPILSYAMLDWAVPPFLPPSHVESCYASAGTNSSSASFRRSPKPCMYHRDKG